MQISFNMCWRCSYANELSQWHEMHVLEVWLCKLALTCAGGVAMQMSFHSGMRCMWWGCGYANELSQWHEMHVVEVWLCKWAFTVAWDVCAGGVAMQMSFHSGMRCMCWGCGYANELSQWHEMHVLEVWLCKWVSQWHEMMCWGCGYAHELLQWHEMHVLGVWLCKWAPWRCRQTVIRSCAFLCVSLSLFKHWPSALHQ